MEIAQRFNAGSSFWNSTSPMGTTECSFVTGLDLPSHCCPSAAALGYFQGQEAICVLFPVICVQSCKFVVKRLFGAKNIESAALEIRQISSCALWELFLIKPPFFAGARLLARLLNYGHHKKEESVSESRQKTGGQSQERPRRRASA